jgi:hypothetical protein
MNCTIIFYRVATLQFTIEYRLGIEAELSRLGSRLTCRAEHVSYVSARAGERAEICESPLNCSARGMYPLRKFHYNIIVSCELRG